MPPPGLSNQAVMNDNGQGIRAAVKEAGSGIGLQRVSRQTINRLLPMTTCVPVITAGEGKSFHRIQPAKTAHTIAVQV